MKGSIVLRGAVLAMLAALVVSAPVLAEEGEEKVLEVGKWYPTAETGVTLTQSSYSSNWAGGDKGSVVWAAIFNGTLENQLRNSLNWNNTLKLAFGQTHQQDSDSNGELVWQRPQKSTDLIDYETIFRLTKGWAVDPFVSGRLESQFIDASDPQDRNIYVNPIQLKESVGIARKLINEEERELLTRVGFTLRQNLRRVFTGAAPDTETELETTDDGGIEWVTDYKSKIFEDKVAWTSKLSVYQPLFYSDDDSFKSLSADTLDFYGIDREVADFTEVPDINWENIFSTQITKFISLNFYVEFVYDKYDNSVPPVLNADGSLKNAAGIRAATRKKGQFKQTMAIGVTYRFL